MNKNKYSLLFEEEFKEWLIPLYKKRTIKLIITILKTMAKRYKVLNEDTIKQIFDDIYLHVSRGSRSKYRYAIRNYLEFLNNKKQQLIK